MTDHLAAIRNAVHDVSEVRASLSHITHELDKYQLIDAEKAISAEVEALARELAEAEARAERTRQYADWLEAWAASGAALNERQMRQERQRLRADGDMRGEEQKRD